jgi:hypothetical protein
MVAVGDIVELVIEIDGPNGTSLNVLGFEARNVAATFDGLASSFDTNDLSGYTAQMGTGFSCSLLRVVDIKPGTAATVLHGVSPAKAGTNTSESLPTQSALVFSWRSALKGRSFRGRTYMMGLGETNQAAGVWGAATVTAMDTWADSFLARYSASDPASHWRFGVISKFSGGLKRATPIITPVVDFAVDTEVFTQRRRGRGVR